MRKKRKSITSIPCGAVPSIYACPCSQPPLPPPTIPHGHSCLQFPPRDALSPYNVSATSTLSTINDLVIFLPLNASNPSPA